MCGKGVKGAGRRQLGAPITKTRGGAPANGPVDRPKGARREAEGTSQAANLEVRLRKAKVESTDLEGQRTGCTSSSKYQWVQGSAEKFVDIGVPANT